MNQPVSSSDIAVVGRSCRVPGASSPRAFWDNLRAGIESIRVLSDDELVESGVDRKTLADPRYVKAAAVLDDLELFDAGFFGLSPREGAIMDPQHRHFLECAWEALESAGHSSEELSGNIGVFAACGMNAYFMNNVLQNRELLRSVGLFLLRHTGNDKDFLATRVSYAMNLTGPSLNVQTACSSSLVAIHMASQHLLSGECDLALAGGVTIELPHKRGYLYEEGEILSPDGHCRAFDAASKGTVFGSGAGVVVLRRLADALEDGDTIHAVIKGSAVNNDGSSKVGYLAPSVDGQAKAVVEALSVAGISADTISYVEAHGTGTPVGDPIEIAALTQAFRAHTANNGYCRIGSVKSNIGHLDTAAGVASFIKVVEALSHRELPPSLHFERPNPLIEFERTPFVVNASLRPWTTTGSPRRAGVSSLGVGGTNAHVIVEEAPPRLPADSAPADQVLVLSARTPAALDAMRSNLADRLSEPDAPSLADVAFTLQCGRAGFPYRWSAASTDHATAIRALRERLPEALRPVRSSTTPVAFLFPGGGVQYPNMARDLYEREPVFRAELDRALAIASSGGGDLRSLLFPATADGSAAAKLARSTSSILSIFVVEYALARLWMSWGVTPAAMSGHSLGEYVAACLSGVFSLEDALTIVKARGDIFERMPAGAMLSVPVPEERARVFVGGRLAVAAVNAPESVVISGPVAEIETLAARLLADGIEAQRLHIDVAAHSPMLDPFLADFRRCFSRIEMSAPSIPFISNLSGRWIEAREATDAEYWVRHLRSTVRFGDGLATLLSNPDQVLLEVGPGRSLTSLARQQPSRPLDLITSLRHPSDTIPDRVTMVAAAGRLWAAGASVDWRALHQNAHRRRVELPTYPFERQRYWIDADEHTGGSTEPSDASTDRRADVTDWFTVPAWQTTPLSGEPTALRGDALVFADASGVVEAAVQRLRSETSRVYIVGPGASFERHADDRFRLDPGSADDYVSLFDAIGAPVAEIRHIVHGWTIGEPREHRAPGDLEDAFFAPLALLQAVARFDLSQPIALDFVTSSATAISGGESVAAARAAIFGPARVAPRELPSITTRVIDVQPPTSPLQRDRLIRALAAEIAAEGPGLVAYRNGVRWTQTQAARPLAPTSSSGLRTEGVYLITGGLGAIGLEIAKSFAAARARLVLVSRTPLPSRDEWSSWLDAHAADDRVSHAIRTIRDCEALGARVLVLAADIASREAMTEVRTKVFDEFGRIDGIVHAAGTLDDKVMPLKTRESALNVLAPKVLGTVVLDEVFLRDEPDFILLFSSVSALLGLEGQADYTAANACLDAYAESKAHHPSTRVIAVNWGAWKDVGLAAAAGRSRRRHDSSTGHPWIDEAEVGSTGVIQTVTYLSRQRQWVVDEHVVRGGDAVLPGAGYHELARGALSARHPDLTGIEIADLIFEAPIVVPPSGEIAVEQILTPQPDGYDCTWRLDGDIVASARISPVEAPRTDSIDLEVIRRRCSREQLINGLVDQPFMSFGPRWANVTSIRYGHDEALIALDLPPAFTNDLDVITIHPALLDMATGGAQRLIAGFDGAHDFYVPVSYGTFRQVARFQPRLFSHIRLSPASAPGMPVFDATIVDGTGAIVADVTNFCMKRVAAPSALGTRATPMSDNRQPVAGALADEMLREGIGTTEGLDALNRILANDAGPRIAVSPGDIHAWFRRVAQSALRPTNETSPTGPADADGDVFAGFDETERVIAGLWQELLGVRRVSVHDNFFDVGGHSLVAVRLVSRLDRHFHVGLRVSAVFDAPTFGALSALVRDRLANRTTGAAEAHVADSTPALVSVSRDTFRANLRDLVDAEDDD